VAHRKVGQSHLDLATHGDFLMATDRARRDIV